MQLQTWVDSCRRNADSSVSLFDTLSDLLFAIPRFINYINNAFILSFLSNNSFHERQQIGIYLVLLYSCCKCPGHQIVCKNHCLNKCDDRKIFHGRILFLEGSLLGARANVSCDGGFHVRGVNNICIKTETVQCIKSKYGCDWRSQSGLSIPSCDRMGKLQWANW